MDLWEVHLGKEECRQLSRVPETYYHVCTVTDYYARLGNNRVLTYTNKGLVSKN